MKVTNLKPAVRLLPPPFRLAASQSESVSHSDVFIIQMALLSITAMRHALFSPERLPPRKQTPRYYGCTDTESKRSERQTTLAKSGDKINRS